MNELIPVNYDENNGRPTVLGRDLHRTLEIKTAYKDWFPRMCEYGFTEGEDFCSFLSESTGGRPGADHQMTIEMAKEICMIQRNDKGKQVRKYFIELEKRWNEPEAVMARALKLAEKKINALETKNKILMGEALTWADRPLINAIIRRYASQYCNGKFAFAWTEFKKELLYRYGININLRITTQTNLTGKKPKTLDVLTDEELPDALRTIVSLCESNEVNIDDLLKKQKECA